MAQEIVGSNPIARPIGTPSNNAPVAQWIEHLASDQGVAGSSPARRARKYTPLDHLFDHTNGLRYYSVYDIFPLILCTPDANSY